MFHWFIKFLEFAEFAEISAHLGKNFIVMFSESMSVLLLH